MLFVSFFYLQGKVPLLSLEATHQLHIFIFVMAITHVIFSVTTMLLGSAQVYSKAFDMPCGQCGLAAELVLLSLSVPYIFHICQIRQWKQWEDEIQKDASENGIKILN